MNFFNPVAGILFLVLSCSLLRGETQQENSCVACHRGVGGVSYLEHNFSDWEKSVHARAGIRCETCHGGNPSEGEKRAAHKGMMPSTNSKSLVYYTRIPATCGTCHQAEFKAFKRSAHYRDLQSSGRGPNCVTCHGSMANHVLAPRELEMTCTVCHRRPTQAYATLMALNNAGETFKRLEKTLQESHGQKADISRQGQDYQKIMGMYRHTLEDWHTFKMMEVLKAAQEVTRRSVDILNELQIKELQKHGTPQP
ncbi:MAG: hypothetical protein HY400_05685 [Elusimicrobia bacterium]|nr:hypothetical protein [Elusimicrobiota bacterium]